MIVETRGFRVAAPLAAFAALLVIWQVWVTVAGISVLLVPSPVAILQETIDNLPYLLWLSANTAVDALGGTIIGIVAAILVAWVVHGSTRLSAVSTTLATGFKSMPIIALFPIAAIFLGNGPSAVMAIVALAAFPLAFIYAVAGLRRTSPLDELVRVVAAGPIRRFWSLRLPLAIPYLLAGVSTVLPLAVISAIVAEYFGGPITSLGTYIRRESAQLHTVEMWSAIVMACVLGLAAAGLGALAVRAARRFEGTAGRR